VSSAASQFTRSPSTSGMEQAVVEAQRLGQRRALGAQAAEVGRMRRVATYREAGTVTADQHAAAHPA